MATVLLVVHQERAEAATLAVATASWLGGAGHEVRVPDTDAGCAPELGRFAATGAALVDGVDVAVSLGGDGTMLRTVDLVAAHDVPVIGVNLGQLGYLTEVEPGGLQEALADFLAGRHAIEERMLLDVRIDAPSGGVTTRTVTALNEVVLEKTVAGHTVRLDVIIDGIPFTPYAADGLIVATPTGSTAYAFSARGPIVAPTHRAILLTPVSPHMLFDRTLVLEPGTVLALRVDGHRRSALAVDGRLVGELAPGDTVTCTASPHVARLVIFGPRDFHRILKAKFGLNDR